MDADIIIFGNWQTNMEPDGEKENPLIFLANKQSLYGENSHRMHSL